MPDNKPYIEEHSSKSFVVRVQFTGCEQAHYWNHLRGRWIPWDEIHRGTACNDRASYFRSREAAEKAITQINTPPDARGVQTSKLMRRLS